MPPESSQQNARRDAIRELLSNESIRTQSALLQRLKALGHLATQSSISRDLKELRVVKNPEGYRLADAAPPVATMSTADFIRGVTTAGPNMLVIHTATGAAQRVALELDRSGWPEIVGTISGDDTIFIATSGRVAGRRLQERLADFGPGYSS